MECVEKYKSEASGYICGRYNWEDVVERTLDVYRLRRNRKSTIMHLNNEGRVNG